MDYYISYVPSADNFRLISIGNKEKMQENIDAHHWDEYIIKVTYDEFRNIADCMNMQNDSESSMQLYRLLLKYVVSGDSYIIPTTYELLSIV